MKNIVKFGFLGVAISIIILIFGISKSLQHTNESNKVQKSICNNPTIAKRYSGEALKIYCGDNSTDNTNLTFVYLSNSFGLGNSITGSFFINGIFILIFPIIIFVIIGLILDKRNNDLIENQ